MPVLYKQTLKTTVQKATHSTIPGHSYLKQGLLAVHNTNYEDTMQCETERGLPRFYIYGLTLLFVCKIVTVGSGGAS